MKCIECDKKVFQKCNGAPNRYYCQHPLATAGIGSRLICRTERGSEKLTTKTAPRWCPLKKEVEK